jgi:hypothetical protein
MRMTEDEMHEAAYEPTWEDRHMDALVERAVKAEQQRDDLLRALRPLTPKSIPDDLPEGMLLTVAVSIANLRRAMDIIAKIEGGK